MRRLGQSLQAEFKRRPIHLSLFVSHTHWDHIQGFPYFAPIYESRCRLRIFGGEGTRTALKAAFTGQMDGRYFPVSFSRLPSNIEIRDLGGSDLAVGQVLVSALRANHPGNTFGFKLVSPGGTIVFLPDNEPLPSGDDHELLDFIRDADVLILDSQYDRAGYCRHVDWGHGCVDDSVALALKAGVRQLILFHHDPDHDDKMIDSFVRHARRLVARAKGKLKVEAAREGMVLRLGKK